MPEGLLIPTAIAYMLVVGALFAYGVNFLYLTWLAWRNRFPQSVAPSPPPTWPRVTVQIPIYNEFYVAERIVKAVAELDYPRHLLEIQVLDDSTDETSEILDRLIRILQADGHNIHHLRRKHREGFKAGALAYGLGRAWGEFIAIFDADAVPPRDFLRRALPHFADPRIAFVQARWGHLDREHSLITRLQSIAIDAHFKVEQYARSRAGYWFNFNGTSGVWRRVAIEGAGGWRADTLTEDLDLSYRAFLRDWRAVYLDDLEVPSELPASIAAYRRQQRRWAHGSMECALNMLPRLWAAPNPLRIKLQATLHLTGYTVQLLLVALSLLYPLVLQLSKDYPGLITLFGLALIFNATTLAPTLLFVAGQRRQGRPGWSRLPLILLLSAGGVGMMVNTAGAALDILRRRRPAFERTPKFALVGRGQSWLGKKYQLRLDGIVIAEALFAGLNGFTAIRALSQGNFVIALYASVFALGLSGVVALSLGQAIRNYHRQRGWRRAASTAGP